MMVSEEKVMMVERRIYVHDYSYVVALNEEIIEENIYMDRIYSYIDMRVFGSHRRPCSPPGTLMGSLNHLHLFQYLDLLLYPKWEWCLSL
ncbi:hypothetical protein Sjap_015972 [Stephania japonica]|uniref:Uncharacterized protein n=1 Tax=Stephania japonica TaxID=461633 RepID=A0AAP0NTB5_9MAGN